MVVFRMGFGPERWQTCGTAKTRDSRNSWLGPDDCLVSAAVSRVKAVGINYGSIIYLATPNGRLQDGVRSGADEVTHTLYINNALITEK